jgi:CarD family transcriptional regulator
MQFKVGDPVVHWSYGLGKVVALQTRALAGEKNRYYVVRIRDVTVWVPVDEKAHSRIRPPTSRRGFKKLLQILGEPGKNLSDDRHERKIALHNRLAVGNAESVCSVIRDLATYQHKKGLNDDDKQILSRASSSLLGEWAYAFSLSAAEADDEMQGVLRHPFKRTAAERGAVGGSQQVASLHAQMRP